MAALNIPVESKKQMEEFYQEVSKEAEMLVSRFFPQKIEELGMLVKTSFTDDPASLKAPLDIPIPDPAKEEAKRKKKEEMEAKEGNKTDSDKEDEDSGPPCGPISINEKVHAVLKLGKAELQILKEKVNTVTLWLQLQIPKIEDGNNFGVAVQEKVFELVKNKLTRIEALQAQLEKYHLERGDTVTKAAKYSHVEDYRQLIHELDKYMYSEACLIILEILNTYAVMHDTITKNYSKIVKPRGDGKAPIY